MPRAVEILRLVAPRAYPNYERAFDNGDALLREFGIDTPLRIAHLLAQVLHETGGGTVLFESLTYRTADRADGDLRGRQPFRGDPSRGGPRLARQRRGAGRARLRPRESKEGPGARQHPRWRRLRYRGGGALQTTGGANYRRMGEKVGVDFYGDPHLIVAPEHALKPALHEWAAGELNAAADRNDIRRITRVINGGYNGLPERRHWFDRIWPLANGGGGPLPAWGAAEPDAETRWLQEALNDLGARPPLLVDGRYGPATTAAVRWFQSVAGLKIDGIAGDVTRAAIRLRLATIRGG